MLYHLLHVFGLDLAGPRQQRARLRRVIGIALAVVAALCLLALAARYAHAQMLDKPALVVATPELRGGWRGTVMLAAPFQGQHVGVILNRPSKVTMAQVFPGHAPSLAVTDPVYFGGPVNVEAVGALIRSEAAPHPLSIELAPGVWLVLHTVAIDAIIEATPNAARYFVGFVVWKPGELAEEVRTGKMVLRPVDQEKLFLPDTSHLWENLAPKKGVVES